MKERRHRPWGDYAMRVLACALLFGSAYGLLSQSTFALRLRDDAPGGANTLAMALAGVLAVVPLLMGRRFLGAFLVSGFLASGVGAYWWTKVSWDELVTESDFNVAAPPGLWDYALVAMPALVAVFYAVASRPSRLKAEYRNRGLDEAQIARAAWAAWIGGVGLFLAVGGLSFGFWVLMSSGAVFDMARGVPVGVPAIVVAVALLTVAIALGSNRLPRAGAPAWITRPWKAAAGLAARARSRARKSPS